MRRGRREGVVPLGAPNDPQTRPRGIRAPSPAAITTKVLLVLGTLVKPAV